MFKIKICMICFLILLSCSAESDKELFESARKNLSENKIEEAVEGFSQILDDYPQSEFVEETLFELGSIYLNKADKNISGQESLKKGIEYYQKIYKKYPASKEAPKALFMTAFIQANQLNETVKAEENYKLFLHKYPMHSLAKDAETELGILGMNPEEVLSRAQSGQNFEQ
ncbi:MAG: outer membrane protein assembly factor BamD [Ignavibacteria bacterium]|nr:outer membrane protein assembly factor BamD [Ignavibacteria bacterium]